MTFKRQYSLANSPNGTAVPTELANADSAALPHILMLSVAILLLHFSSTGSYLLLHSLVEVFRIAVLGAVFSVGWLSRH
jgi:hypothetical protein